LVSYKILIIIILGILGRNVLKLSLISETKAFFGRGEMDEEAVGIVKNSWHGGFKRGRKGYSHGEAVNCE